MKFSNNFSVIALCVEGVILNKTKELSNVRVHRNCQQIGVPQNAIPDAQELILLRGGHYGPPPCKVGLRLQTLNFGFGLQLDNNLVPDPLYK